MDRYKQDPSKTERNFDKQRKLVNKKTQRQELPFHTQQVNFPEILPSKQSIGVGSQILQIQSQQPSQSTTKRIDLEINTNVTTTNFFPKQPEKSAKSKSKDIDLNLTGNRIRSSSLQNNQQTQALPVIPQSPMRQKYEVPDYLSIAQRMQESVLYNSSIYQHPYTQRLEVEVPNQARIQSREQKVFSPNNQGEFIINMKNHPQANQGPANFESYMRKVIKSVENRKQLQTTKNASQQIVQNQRLGQVLEAQEIRSSKAHSSARKSEITTPLRNQLLNASMIDNKKPDELQEFKYTNLSQMKRKKKTEYLKIEEQGEISQSNLQLEIIKGKHVADLKKSDNESQKLQTSEKSEQAIVQYQERQLQPKATEQVAYLLRETQKKDKIFIPLERSTDPNSNLMYREMVNPPPNHAGVVVFSKNGFVTVGKDKNAISDFKSNQQFIEEGVDDLILKELPFFKKFQSMRIFKQWKFRARWNYYCRKREQLAQRFFFAKPIFAERFSKVVPNINTLRFLPLLEIKLNTVYGKKQQNTLEETCRRVLGRSMKEVTTIIADLTSTVEQLKDEILEDDRKFEKSVKEGKEQRMIKKKGKGEDLVIFTQERMFIEKEKEQYRIQKQRHQMYDKFLDMILKFCQGNLLEVQVSNKHTFQEVFTDLKIGPQFEILVVFNNEGVLATDPTLEHHQKSFSQLFENIETSIFKNDNLTQFLEVLQKQYFVPKEFIPKVICNIFIFISSVKRMRNILNENQMYKTDTEKINSYLNVDCQKGKDYLIQFKNLQEVYDFSEIWEQDRRENKPISLEMGFYRETWQLMDRFNSIIDQIPSSNTKLGSVLIETLTLKKYLMELPKKVIDSMRSNVTTTLENEAKNLREELSKTSEVLDQLPTSLNVYVEQVNTIKYVKEKQDEFSLKFHNINKLHSLCKNLPDLVKSAGIGLKQNKDTMEKIMLSSSMVLSKKIKAFEKKYVQTYLQDKGRIEESQDTLEELFKRSKAIQEIRSKVILYKEFLKLLYEDDQDAEQKIKNNKLQCSEDYEFVADLHKQTIKLWKILLYWRKRRQMCYQTPFLQLDTTKIIRSINKVNHFFDDVLMRNQFIREKCKVLSRIVVQQVKETSMIIEFVKELKKESLRNRHWIQIFNLIKANHLKNSTNFTLINLREYHIQNYREEINQIIEQANTELKYEMIFKSIKDEWEELELKIVPFRENMEYYILINTDTLIQTIEENLTTLETIQQSPYTIHIRGDIEEWIGILKLMLKNLEIWVEAQKHWLNIDPIFSSDQLSEFFKEEEIKKFLELRNKYKRIVWSSFKNPKATYNLKIQSRIDLFQSLIQYFGSLQKKVSEYLEQKRTHFPRFYFLTDSQFLDFLILANSNQDFSQYINQLFQGAQSFYINKVEKVKDDTQTQNQVEKILQIQYNKTQNSQRSDNSEIIINQKEFLTLKVPESKFSHLKVEQNQEVLSQNTSEDSGSESSDSVEEGNNFLAVGRRKSSSKIRSSFMLKKLKQEAKGNQLSKFQILGMINLSKELFLFENSVKIERGVESWISKVERSMKDTVYKMVKEALTSFTSFPIEEWVLDYPQQIILTSIHIILTHEINDCLEELENPNKVINQTLENTDEDQDHNQAQLSKQATNTFSKKNTLKKKDVTLNSDDSDIPLAEHLRKKNEKRAQQEAKEEEERKRLEDEEKKRKQENEIPKDHDREKRKLIDDMFGKYFPTSSKLFIEIDPQLSIHEKRFFDETQKFKNSITNILKQRTMQGLSLRVQYWINSIIKSINLQQNQKTNIQTLDMELHCSHKMVMRSYVLFLQYQRDIIESLYDKNIQEVNDFEWQSKIRMNLDGEFCKVSCGGWATFQQNEYLGNNQRIVITPLTQRYFLFISSALRENSSVLFKCVNSHSYGEDVFEEFSSICAVPSRKINCQSKTKLKQLLQSLNGAALANCWIFYEHMDKLPYQILQVLNKEIQIVQQQYIIAEVNKQKEFQDQQLLPNRQHYSMVHMNSVQLSQNISIKKQKEQTIREKKNSNQFGYTARSSISQLPPPKEISPFVPSRILPYFGVFGSISSSFQVQNKDISHETIKGLQSGFRTISLLTPDFQYITEVLLKVSGFEYANQLYQSYQDFMKSFNEQIEREFKLKLDQIERSDSRDLKNLVKFATIIKNQEIQQFYRQAYYDYKQKQKAHIIINKFNERAKDISIKMEEHEQWLKKEEDIEGLRKKVEIQSFKDALRMLVKQKYYCQIRKIEEIMEISTERKLDQIINESLEKGFPQEQMVGQIQVISSLTNTKMDINPSYQAPFTTNEANRLMLRKSEYDVQSELKQKNFIQQIQKAMNEIITEMKLDKINSQIRNCFKAIDFMRRFKGIVLVGPTSSGKTSILKIVSMTLYKAYQVSMRTSIVNPAIHHWKEIYGLRSGINEGVDQQYIPEFGSQSIFSLILDLYGKEREILEKRSTLLIQSLYFDSCEINSPLAESLLIYLKEANKRESEKSTLQEYLINFQEKDLENEDQQQEQKNNDRQYLPIRLPNGNIQIFPDDLYLFFETPHLKDCSPGFLNQTGLIVTEDLDLSWKNMFQRYINLYYIKHKDFFDKYELDPEIYCESFYQEFMETFIDTLWKHPRISSWSYMNLKSCTFQFFNILNALTFKLNVNSQMHEQDDDINEYPLNECQKDIFWSCMLSSCIWSFGAVLSKDLRKIFKEMFQQHKRKFNISLSSGAIGISLVSRQRSTIFDIYYEPEKLQWEQLQERLEYKLRLHYDALNNNLLIPTSEASQSYHLIDQVLGSIKNETALDKHVRLLGPSSTSKTIIMNTFMKKNTDSFNYFTLPMSSYLSIQKLKSTLESYYTSKSRNQLELTDKSKRLILMIDDIHLQSNLRTNFLEFIRVFCIAKGYYDLKLGLFKNITGFGTFMTQNSEYRGDSYCKVEGRSQLESRFLFYTSTLYLDQFEMDTYKVFIQHWLTSKMWSTSKLVNKFYIIITNAVMSLLEKMKKQESFNNSSFLKLINFNFFSRFCSNFLNFTMISDDPKDILKFKHSSDGVREEDSMVDMMAYELSRTYGDRIFFPAVRTQFLNKVAECCKNEFLSGTYMNAQYVDNLLLGNYHDKVDGAHIKYINYTNQRKEVKEKIREKLKKHSGNQYLEAFISAPNGLKEIFRMSRVFYKEMQHLIIVGQPGCGNIEFLQLACIINDAVLMEINVTKYGDSQGFANAFKETMISCIGLNQQMVLLISDTQIKDVTYIDFVHNYIVNLCNQEKCILFEEGFKEEIIKMERENFKNDKQGSLYSPSNDMLFLQAIRKLQKNLHIVLMINNLQTYFQWISLFPSLEVKCDVLYIDELSDSGFRQWSLEYFEIRDKDNPIFNDQKLNTALTRCREFVKQRIYSCFYHNQNDQFKNYELFMNYYLGEFIMKNQEKLQKPLFKDGNFETLVENKKLQFDFPVDKCFDHKTRFVMYLELFRFLYDFQSMNLVIKRNYQETFLRKVGEFAEFFKDIKKTKKHLYDKSSDIAYQFRTIQDQIVKLNQAIKEKQVSIEKRKQEIKQVEVELKSYQYEIKVVLDEKNENIIDVLQKFDKINDSELTYIVTQQEFNPYEQSILDHFAVVIDKDSRRLSYSRHEHSHFFMKKEDLINILKDRMYYEYDLTVLQRLKSFVNQYEMNEVKQKKIFIELFNYLNELFKKLNVKITQAQTFQRIKELKDQLDSYRYSISYSEQFIQSKEGERKELEKRHSLINDKESILSKKIEEAEISHMRTEQIYDQVTAYAIKVHAKLQDVKARLACLIGDCIIMAASVVYTGVFSIKERMQLRHEMSEYISSTQGIKTSKCWNELEQPDFHNFLFKQLLKEYGLQKELLSHNFSRSISKYNLVESLFTLVFAPSCPLIIDPSGNLQQYLTTAILSNLKVRKLSASDPLINSKLEQVFRSQQFAILNDFNDSSYPQLGLSHTEPLLQRLTHTVHNGFEQNYERVIKLKELGTLGSFFNSVSSTNQRIQTNIAEFQNLSLYQVQVFTPHFQLGLNNEYLSRMTILCAMDNEEEIVEGDIEGWMEVKEVMLKHFLPQKFQEMVKLKSMIKQFDIRKQLQKKNFENIFLVANQESLQNVGEYKELKQSVLEIMDVQEQRNIHVKKLQEILDDYELLCSYSHILVIMYASLKKLSKIKGEITYSWKMYLSLIDHILSNAMKLVKQQLTQEQKEVQTKESLYSFEELYSEKVEKSVQDTRENESQSELNIDESFFHQLILPAIHYVIIGGIKVELIPLYNLILSLNIGFKRRQISKLELDYLYKNLFELKEFEKWREPQHSFLDQEQNISKDKYFNIKTKLIELYPDFARKFFSILEKELGALYQYKKASLFINGKMYQQYSDFDKMTVQQKVNFGFLCPDNEFKSKLTQLVYETLTQVFNYSEDHLKLDQFLKIANWSHPIGLYTHDRLNVISSICSLAQTQGVSLEIIRSDTQLDNDIVGHKIKGNKINHDIGQNMVDYSYFKNNEQTYERIYHQASTLQKEDFYVKGSVNGDASKILWTEKKLRADLRTNLKNQYKEKGEMKDPLEVIEIAALNGNWVFISTIRFPNFWQKMCLLLDAIKIKQKLNPNFRLILDLQNFNQNEIPDSFIFDNSISFHLQEEFSQENINSDSKDTQLGVKKTNDIWSTILDEKILEELCSPQFFYNNFQQNDSSDQYEGNKSKKELEMYDQYLKNVNEVEEREEEKNFLQVKEKDPVKTLFEKKTSAESVNKSPVHRNKRILHDFSASENFNSQQPESKLQGDIQPQPTDNLAQSKEQ